MYMPIDMYICEWLREYVRDAFLLEFLPYQDLKQTFNAHKIQLSS